MAVTDGSSLPVAVCIESASPHEVRLVEATIDSRFTAETPDRTIGDKAYDSDDADQRVAKRFGTRLIAPHRAGRKKEPTQDGRELRRYRRRWGVERFFAWLQNYRRLVTRWEYNEENFLAMIQLGCILILLRRF